MYLSLSKNLFDKLVDGRTSSPATTILNSQWSFHTFAPPCANACAVFRPCGLRFAPCPRGSSRFAASDAHKLACGTPCFIGVFVPACASLARYSGAAERFALSSPLRGFDGFGLFRAARSPGALAVFAHREGLPLLIFPIILRKPLLYCVCFPDSPYTMVMPSTNQSMARISSGVRVWPSSTRRVPSLS